MRYPKLNAYPGRIKLGRYVIKLKFVDAIDDKNSRGEYTFHKRKLKIKRGLGRKLTYETFIHEMLHAIEDCYGVAIPHTLVHSLEEPLAKLILSIKHL